MGNTSKTVAITGAGTCFEERTAQMLAKRDHMVVASMHDIRGKTALPTSHLEPWAKGRKAKLAVSELDVTSDLIHFFDSLFRTYNSISINETGVTMQPTSSLSLG